MGIKVPMIAKLAFGEHVQELQKDLEEVENLLKSNAENKRAGAVALLATQFDLSKDILVEKLKSCQIGELSNMVNATIHYYLRPLTITEESIQARAQVRALANASFETHLSNIRHGSRIEKRAALLYAYNHYDDNPTSVLELCELAKKDADPEIRCGAMSAMAHQYYATSNKKVASIYASIALDSSEAEQVRIYAAEIVMLIFGPFPLQKNLPTMNSMSSIEKTRFFEKLRNLTEFGIDGIDTQYLQELSI